MHFLGIDLGTSGTKAVLIDASGRVVSSTTSPHGVSTLHAGWSEQNPEDWWQSTVDAVTRLLRSTLHVNVAAIGLSGQMHGLVMIDSRATTLRPCILWNDQRSAPQCQKIENQLGLSTLIQTIGNRMLPGFMAPKILWCRENEPDLERSARTHLLPKDWLRWRLSGTLATEVSDASGTALFDCGKRRWSEEMLGALGIRRETMPACFESDQVTAQLSKDAARALGLPDGTPIVGGAGDQAASALGAGIAAEGAVAVTIGTSGVVFAACNAWRPAPQGELHAFCHAARDRWHLMGVTLSCGGSLQWYRAIRGLVGQAGYDQLEKEASTAPPGSDELTFLPYLTGERCPYPDPTARGALVGLDASHGNSSISRAVFEGITFALRDNVELMRSLDVPVTRVRLAGGGARSPFWAQLCADIFGVPVEVSRFDEGAGLGVALLAGVGWGAWPSIEKACAAAQSHAETAHMLQPRDPAAYDRSYQRFRQLYPALRSAFNR